MNSYELFNVAAGIASLGGLLFSVLAFAQAKRASRAAIEARNAVTVRTLADEVELACVRAEQVVDFSIHHRFEEAALRVAELTASLSEIFSRRTPYLGDADANRLLTSREQIRSIGDVIQRPRGGTLEGSTNRMIRIARLVVVSLRELLGTVKSTLDQEVNHG